MINLRDPQQRLAIAYDLTHTTVRQSRPRTNVQKRLDRHLLQVKTVAAKTFYVVALFFCLIATISTVLDDEATLALILSALGLIAALIGLALSISVHRTLELFTGVSLQAVLTVMACVLAATLALAIGHSDHFGDGPFRARWRPAKRALNLAAHEVGRAARVGDAELKVVSAQLVDRESGRQGLEIVVELTNPTQYKKIDNISWASGLVAMRDDVGNRYKKTLFYLWDRSVSPGRRDQGTLYPGERMRCSYWFEPPVDGASHLDLTLRLPPLTPSTGLLFRIPKTEWRSASTQGNKSLGDPEKLAAQRLFIQSAR